MQNYHLLRRYIREAIDLGQIQFSPDRLDQGVNRSEPNTPEEEELYAALRSRIDNTRNVDEKTANILSQLIDSEKYGTKGSGFFQGPKPGIQLYRGHAVDKDWVDKHISNPDEINTYVGFVTAMGNLINSHTVALKVPYVFAERRGWSKDQKIATNWAVNYAMGEANIAPGASAALGAGQSDRGDRSRPFAVIYVIDTNDVPHNAMLDFEHSVYKTKMGSMFSHEKEVMNLFPIAINKVKIINTKLYREL